MNKAKFLKYINERIESCMCASIEMTDKTSHDFIGNCYAWEQLLEIKQMLLTEAFD